MRVALCRYMDNPPSVWRSLHDVVYSGLPALIRKVLVGDRKAQVRIRVHINGSGFAPHKFGGSGGGDHGGIVGGEDGLRIIKLKARAGRALGEVLEKAAAGGDASRQHDHLGAEEVN